MHKAANKVIEYALKNKSCKIVIGDIKGIKQNMNYNKNFVQLPVQEIVQKIEYKAKLRRIELERITEEYTSGCSSLDLEEISKRTYKKARRIKRGLFKTNKGTIINADVNGSLNILRKYIEDKSIPKLIQEAMDNGRTGVPIRSLIS